MFLLHVITSNKLLLRQSHAFWLQETSIQKKVQELYLMLKRLNFLLRYSRPNIPGRAMSKPSCVVSSALEMPAAMLPVPEASPKPAKVSIIPATVPSKPSSGAALTMEESRPNSFLIELISASLASV